MYIVFLQAKDIHKKKMEVMAIHVRPMITAPILKNPFVFLFQNQIS